MTITTAIPLGCKSLAWKVISSSDLGDSWLPSDHMPPLPDVDRVRELAVKAHASVNRARRMERIAKKKLDMEIEAEKSFNQKYPGIHRR